MEAAKQGIKKRYGAAKEAAKQRRKQRNEAAKDAAKKQRNEAGQEAAKEATRRTRRYAMRKSKWDYTWPDILWKLVEETSHEILPGRANLPFPARLHYRVNMEAFLRLTEGNDKDRYLAPIVLID